MDALLLLTPAIQGFGFPNEALKSLYAVLTAIRSDTSNEDQELNLNALKLIAHIAAMVQDVKLADAVAEVCIERIPLIEERQINAQEHLSPC